MQQSMGGVVYAFLSQGQIRAAERTRTHNTRESNPICIIALLSLLLPQTGILNHNILNSIFLMRITVVLKAQIPESTRTVLETLKYIQI